jgi:hypothetical protein
VLWDLASGRLLYAQGARDVAEMPAIGREYGEFFGQTSV